MMFIYILLLPDIIQLPARGGWGTMNTYKSIDISSITPDYASKVKAKKQSLPTSGMYEDANAFLLLSNLDDYRHKLTLIIKELIKGKKIVYVSYNKIPKYTKKILEGQGINVENISFINCVNTQGNGDITIPPEDLAQISMMIPETAVKDENTTVIVNTISSFSAHHSRNTITNFVASMNDEARNQNYDILWIAIDELSEKQLNSRLSQLCDETIKT